MRVGRRRRRRAKRRAKSAARRVSPLSLSFSFLRRFQSVISFYRRHRAGRRRLRAGSERGEAGEGTQWEVSMRPDVTLLLMDGSIETTRPPSRSPPRDDLSRPRSLRTRSHHRGLFEAFPEASSRDREAGRKASKFGCDWPKRKKSMKDKAKEGKRCNFASLAAATFAATAPRLPRSSRSPRHHRKHRCPRAMRSRREGMGRGKGREARRGEERRETTATTTTNDDGDGERWPSALLLSLPSRHPKNSYTHLVLPAGLLLEQVLSPGVARAPAGAADLDLRDAPGEERAEGDGDQGDDGRQRRGEAVVHDRIGHAARVVSVVRAVVVGRRRRRRRTLEQGSCHCVHSNRIRS